MTWQPTPKLYGYLVLVVVGTVCALASGRPEALVLAAPFALALAVGLSRTGRMGLEVSTEVDKTTTTEGEALTVTALFNAALDVAGLEAFFAPGPAFKPAGPFKGRPQGLRLKMGQPSTLNFELSAQQWGNQDVGKLYVRARSALGLLESEGAVAVPGMVTVYPSAQSLRALVRSSRTTLAAGAQLGSVKGSGTDLAGVRPYVNGDRARDVNWRASARHQGLYTNERHPDRSTDVVLALDTFDACVMSRAVRAACALADAYLAQRDRVGLVRFGGALSWLRPGMGMRQRYLVVQLLLSTEAVPSVLWRGLELLPPRVLPPHALIVCLSSLEDERSRSAMLNMRERGLDFVVVEVPPVAAPLPELGLSGGAAHRLWKMKREMSRDGYRAVGVPVAEWSEGRSLSDVVEEVNAWSRRTVRA